LRLVGTIQRLAAIPWEGFFGEQTLCQREHLDSAVHNTHVSRLPNRLLRNSKVVKMFLNLKRSWGAIRWKMLTIFVFQRHLNDSGGMHRRSGLERRDTEGKRLPG
jgi:hypothetical protein